MTIFIISDTHFGHENMLGFKLDDGSLLRPNFRDAAHMDETMVERWNSAVKPSDHVYHLGDVAMKRKMIPIVKRLNGHKRLVFGNHDIYDYREYAEAGFEKLMAIRVIDGLIMTHIPIHTSNFGRFKLNVHGHVHANDVKLPDGTLDKRYFNASVERINYTPVSLEEIKAKIP